MKNYNARLDPFERPWAPGLKERKNAGDRASTWYWVAAQCSRHAKDYPVKTVRLHEEDEDGRAARCRALYAELMQWLAANKPEKRALEFDGSIRSLCEHYELHPESPYHTVKHTTRESYDFIMSRLKRILGQRQLRSLHGTDFIRWHRQFLTGEDGQRHVHKAHTTMSMLRRIIRWGVVLELPEAARLNTILSEMEFEAPKPRSTVMTFDQSMAIINKALELGRVSMAITQAMQFELTVRRADIIGEWVPAAEGEHGIILRSRTVRNRQRWANGLTWDMISPEWHLKKVATKTARKTGATIEFDLKSYPLVVELLSRVPADRRIGPVIINETTRQPYTASTYAAIWREVARAAGVPDDVWSMDSRAGGITEGSDAGAGLELLRHHAAHKNSAMTARYSRKTLQKTTEVAHLRMAHRNNKNGGGT